MITENKNQVAKEILSQLGGNKFIAMTGAKNLGAGENYLTFKISSRNKSKASHIKIKLNSMDTYDIFFMKVVKYNVKDLDFVGGVYGDQLQAIFTDRTGLNTSL
jgi:hypothetical protein